MLVPGAKKLKHIYATARTYALQTVEGAVQYYPWSYVLLVR
jgi:hypothetical protein